MINIRGAVRAPKHSRASDPVRPAPRRRVLAFAAVPLIAAAASVAALGGAGVADAAVVHDAITNVEILPPLDPQQGDQVTTEIDWCVPDGTQEGDTFQLDLSSHLTNLPAGFELDDPNSGKPVASASLDGTPSVITFTMTAYASTHLHTCGTAYVTSDFDGTTTPSGQATPFTFTTPDGQSWTTDVTPQGSFGDLTQPAKFATWTRSDQGRVNPTDFLMWTIDTPAGPFSAATVSDPMPFGQDWTYDCGRIEFQEGHEVDGNLVIDGSVPLDPDTDWTCDPTTGFTVNWPAQTVDGELYRVNIPVTNPAATGTTADPVEYMNDATVTTTVDGTTNQFAVHGSKVQAAAGGQGDGTPVDAALTVTKGDTNGNAADTDATAAVLGADGTASLTFHITNSGNEPVSDIALTDAVLANGTVTGLSCDFTPLGGPSAGTTWDGPLAVGASVDCTAALSRVTAGGADHEDVATVTGTGVETGETATATNAYFARVVVAAAAPTPSTPAAAPVATAPVTRAPRASGSELAYTGSDPVLPLGIGGAALAAGVLLLTLARARRRTP